MTDGGNPWSAVVGAWVQFSDLFDTVQREFGIAPKAAASVLRRPLEENQITAEIAGLPWHVRERFNVQGWIFRDEYGNGSRVSATAWAHIYRTGKLEGFPVRVLWAHVVEVLASVRPRSAAGLASSKAIGSEAALARWLAESMRTAPDTPRSQEKMRHDADAAGLKFSDRAFKRAWSTAVISSDAAAWSAAGRRGKSAQ